MPSLLPRAGRSCRAVEERDSPLRLVCAWARPPRSIARLLQAHCGATASTGLQSSPRRWRSAPRENTRFARGSRSAAQGFTEAAVQALSDPECHVVSRHSISPNIRAARRALQKSLFQKRRQDESARAAVNVPQSLGLRFRQLQSRHLSVLALDSSKECGHGSGLTGERDAAFAVNGALHGPVSNRGKQRSRSEAWLCNGNQRPAHASPFHSESCASF